MAQTKKKWVAFKSNATVPGDVMGEDKDQKMQVGEPVQLPAAYADHVVQDGFAAFCDAPKKAAPKKSSGQSAEEKAAADAATKLEAAQARVDDLNAKLGEMSEGDDGWEALTKELDEAVTELAALQAAS
ncbi:hypothetical protein [Phaeobacter sp. 11ANDIMAR09]|uniref:hypothetical protein n=1 Tax=Phaeobacter sp. 11ANDIMAR09 TaxID=1225647 RepID=UPI0006C85612|nr:hypothetical protein [Phaeobacter sp. 11ANDIMAR09]KPD11566.1 hypothetical protein AN476_15095 [Phaeobacter sp. 11ANDIMAR09]